MSFHFICHEIFSLQETMAFQLGWQPSSSAHACQFKLVAVTLATWSRRELVGAALFRPGVVGSSGIPDNQRSSADLKESTVTSLMLRKSLGIKLKRRAPLTRIDASFARRTVAGALVLKGGTTARRPRLGFCWKSKL